MSTRHTSYHLHVYRVIFACLALASVALLHVPFSSPVVEQSSSNEVLAYATNVSVSDLAAGTNGARSQNGLGPLSTNSKLNLSAQLKANDMVSKNYWAHVGPDGTQPWYWFSEAGYDYVGAGENLAYGFSTSDATVAGWMNSAGHRANILGNYQEMGFGIANGENFQGSQNTVVVAHYGTARTTPPAPTSAGPVASAATPPAAASPTPSAPAPTSPAPTTPIAPTEAQPVDSTPTDESQPLATAEPTKNNGSESTKALPSASTTPVVAPNSSAAVPAWQQLIHGTAPVLVIISAAILGVVAIGYTMTHLSLVKHAARVGEQYVLHHPLIDASIATTATIVMLLTTIGHIR